MGELQRSSAAALDPYRHAVDLRRRIAAQPGALPTDRADLALSLAKLGEGQIRTGDTKTALATYQSALDVARPAGPDAARAVGAIDERRCIVLLTTGNTTAALDACHEGVATLSPLAAKSPNDPVIQRLIATTEGSYANALRLSKQPREAEPHARRALELLNALQVHAPNNAEYRRLASSAEIILAGTLASSGDLPAGLNAFHRAVQSMQVALEIDPDDLGSALRLSVALLGFSSRLNATGSRQPAHDLASQALNLLAQTAAKTTAGPVEWNEYANALLKVDAPDLREPAKARRLAEQAVAATHRRNPFFLDTLAWADYRNHENSEAVAIEREALNLLPNNAAGGLKDELSASLRTFEGKTGHRY